VADEETDNKFREPFFNFYDDRLMGLEWSKQPNTELTCQFFRLLALCHTVIPEGRYTAAASRLTMTASCRGRQLLCVVPCRGSVQDSCCARYAETAADVLACDQS
jgi:hypothetical protein